MEQELQNHREANPLTSIAGEMINQHSVVSEQPSWTSPTREYSSGEGTAEHGVLLTDDFLRKISSDSLANGRNEEFNVSCGPCEVCDQLIPISELMGHQVQMGYCHHFSANFTCMSSSFQLTCKGGDMNGVGKGMNGVGKGLNESSGPCRVCGELIAIKDLIRHEVCNIWVCDGCGILSPSAQFRLRVRLDMGRNQELIPS